MTTHINGIVQTTRRIVEIEAAMFNTADAERAQFEAQYSTETDARLAQVLAAIKDGVEPDLIQWAIGVNNSEEL